MEGGDVLGLVSWLTKRAGLLGSLQIDVQPERSGMAQADVQAVQRLSSSLGLLVPDRGEAVANVHLVDIGHRHLAQLRQDVDFQRAEPSSGDAVLLEFRLSGLERIAGNVFQYVQVANGLTASSLAFLDRVEAGPDL